MPTTPGFRSLADQLRSWPDARLSRLLAARPDLATPAPHDSSQLASRAAVRSSLLRALDRLDRLELSVLDAVVVSGGGTAADVAGIVRATPERVQAAVTTLVDLALLWESTSGLRPLSGVADAFGGGPGRSGLLPISQAPLAPEDLTSRIAALSPAARAMLEHVVDRGGEATADSARRGVRPEEARTPAEELLAHRLLTPRGDGSLHASGEIGLALRGGFTTSEPVDDVPEVLTSERAAGLVDRAGAGAAFEFTRRVELLLEQWGLHPPSALRNGGLGVRDLKAAAGHLLVDESTAALVIEVAAAAGLLATAADAAGTPAWVPTDGYDAWSTLGPAARWSALVTAWLQSPRMPALVGTRDPAGKTWNALAPELSGIHQVESRRMALEVLAGLPTGQVLATGTGVASVVAQVAWQRPRRPRTRDDQVAWALREAAALGVSGLDGLTSYARQLLADLDHTDTLDSLLPTPVDHVLLQADLTAIAPGPLESHLARTLALVADVESRGGATTYRFTPGSVRRALDNGWSAAELHEFLGSVSRTPVPQPLSYLVDDTARTFGTIRVGHAESFLRADDETALTELLHHPRTGSLGLRRLAPTVLISTTPLDVLLPRLRELGAAPVVEAPDGTVRVTRPDLLRARTPKEHRSPAAAAAREAARTGSVVSAVRAGDRAAAARPSTASSLTPSGSLAALREAAEAGITVLIGYLDNHGTSIDRVVDPIRVEGGTLTAHDHRSDDVRHFAVHRISSVKPMV